MIYQVEDVLRTVASQVSQAFQISSPQLRLGRDLATEGYWCHGAFLDADSAMFDT